MALRFRKSIKLAPGLRMNLSGSGVSWSLGPRGASIGIGRRGTYLNTGIPGTGLYSRQKLSNGSTSTQRTAKPEKVQLEITVSISDDGTLTFKDASGNLISENLIETAKKQQGEKIKALIQSKCDEINGQIDALGKIHEYVSPPIPHAFEPKSFSEQQPIAPVYKLPGFFCKFFKSCVTKVEREHHAAKERYERDLLSWKQREQEHIESQKQENNFVDRLNSGDPIAMEEWFEDVLKDIAWPQETLVTFDMPSPGVVIIDIDLPEIEDMPNKTANAPQRGYKLTVKEMSPTQVQKLYMQHIHAVGFRIAGEAFAVSPTVETVILSAYSQRPDKSTGEISDEYLYSAVIPRNKWIEINFANLSNLDPVEAFSRFDLRRQMSKTGVFKSIEPYSG